jgi:hypothetical protein
VVPSGPSCGSAGMHVTEVGDGTAALEQFDQRVDASRRLDRLTSELLELHRLEAGQEEPTIVPVHLGLALESTLRAHGWADSVCLDAPDVVIETDPRRLDRIVVNLVANAVHHGGTGVAVTVTAGADTVMIGVSDAGPGVSPEDLPRLFDRHYKASDSPTWPASRRGPAAGAASASPSPASRPTSRRPDRGRQRSRRRRHVPPRPAGRAAGAPGAQRSEWAGLILVAGTTSGSTTPSDWRLTQYASGASTGPWSASS